MPRGVKGSGKASTTTKGDTVRKVPITKKDKAPAKKPRKAYPTIDERIKMANMQIERLTKIIKSRKALVQKSETVLNARKFALVRNEEQLAKEQNKMQRLIVKKDRPAKAASPKIPREELKARRAEALVKARSAKKAEKEKYDKLLAALKDSGKSVDDLLKEIKGSTTAK